MRWSLLFMSFLFGCSAQQPSDPAVLQGVVWISQNASDGKPAASLRFGADGQVHGNDGCNRLFGQAVVGTRIDLSQVATTRMACMHGRDAAFWAAFAQHDRWRVRSNELQLLKGKKVIWRLVGEVPESDHLEQEAEEKE